MAEQDPLAGLTGVLAQFLKNQMQMANGGRRIPMIDKLTKQEEFPVWRDKLMRALRRQDLDKYITTTVPEPDDEEDKA